MLSGVGTLLLIIIKRKSHRVYFPKNNFLSKSNIKYNEIFLKSVDNEARRSSDIKFDINSKSILFNVESFCNTVIDCSEQVRAILNVIDNPIEFENQSFKEYLASLVVNQVHVTYILRPHYGKKRFPELIRNEIYDLVKRRNEKSKKIDHRPFNDYFRILTINNKVIFNESVGFMIMENNYDILGFSSMKNTEQKTSTIFSLSRQETHSKIIGITEHLCDEFVEMSSIEDAIANLNWLMESKFIEEKEYNRQIKRAKEYSKRIKIINIKKNA